MSGKDKVYIMEKQTLKWRDMKRIDGEQLEKIGERIRNRRKELRIKQIDLAMELNISRNVMYKLESGGGSLSVDYLYLLSQRLGVSMDYLVTGEDDKDTDEEDGTYYEVGKVDKGIANLLQGRSFSELRRAERLLKVLFDEY